MASLKIWEVSDMKVWLGNCTTQNLPDKSLIFQLLENKESTYVYSYLYCDRDQTVLLKFSLILYIGIYYWRTLNRRALTGG
jgi:hypothetical protein